MNKNITAVFLLVLAAGCSSNPPDKVNAPPMDPTRTVSEQVCTRTITIDGGNLLCHEVTEAERLARIAEEERLAKARKEAAERAERDPCGEYDSEINGGGAKDWGRGSGQGVKHNPAAGRCADRCARILRTRSG